MNKIRSPLSRSPNNILVYNKSKSFQNQEIPYRRVIAQFKKQHENQHKRNGNSIKKVLQQLSNLKKQLKQIKITNKNQLATQGLDMSTCRKIQAEIRKSSSPESNTRVKSRSNSKNRNSNSHKRQVSTRSRANMKDVPEFSFSIDSKLNKSKIKNQKTPNQKQSEQEDESENNPPFIAGGTKQILLAQKEYQKSAIKQSAKKKQFNDRIATIEANQQHHKHINSLKSHLQIIQVSSPVFSIEQKLKLNIELQRMNKHLTIIPTYTNNPEQYYQSMQIYTRNLNNQFNNLVLILNRSQSKPNWPNQRKGNHRQFKENQQEQPVCKNCMENERKGLQKIFKHDIKKINRQIKQSQQQLQLKVQQLQKAHISNAVLQNDNSRLIQQIQQILIRQNKTNQNNSKLSQEIRKCTQIIQQLQQSRQREASKLKDMERDLRYYKQEIQSIRSNKYGHLDNFKQYTNAQSRNKDLQMVIKELKQKQLLYQSVIQQKQTIFQDLVTKINSKNQPKTIPHAHQQNQSECSIDSAEFYKQKIQIEQKNRQILYYKNEITTLKNQIQQLSLTNRQVNNSLDLCLMQINKLHSQIDDLEAANQKYKDKNLKSRIMNERKSKKQAQASNRKGKALQQINQLIRHHRQIASKDNQ